MQIQIFLYYYNMYMYLYHFGEKDLGQLFICRIGVCDPLEVYVHTFVNYSHN